MAFSTDYRQLRLDNSEMDNMHSRMNRKGARSNATDTPLKQQLPVLSALQSSSPFVRYERGSTPNLYSPGQLHQFGHFTQPERIDWSTIPSSPASFAAIHQQLDMRFQSLMENTYHEPTYEPCQFDDTMKPLCKPGQPSLRGFGNEIAALTRTLNHLKLVEDRQNKQFMVMNKSGTFDQQRQLLATDFDDYNLILMLLESIDDKRVKLLETMNRLEIVDNEQNKLLKIVNELKSVGDRLKEGILTITNGGSSTAIP